MLTLDDIWMKLTTEDIGFFTHRRSHKIPVVAGIYGWFLPLRLRKDPETLLTVCRKIYAYDAVNKGPAKWTAKDAGFTWDPLRVEVARDTDFQVSLAQRKSWQLLTKASTTAQQRFRQALFVSTLFSRPLYVGLSNNLARRYFQHIAGAAEENTFNSRFRKYMGEIAESLTLDQLLFVCVPLRTDAGDPIELTDAQIQMLEEILKVLCQPVFDER